MSLSRAVLRTEGIILNSFRLRDADRMVVIFTKEQGKLKAVMKAASKARNRFAANAEIGHLVDAGIFFRTPQSETGRIIELTIRNPFVSLRQSIERIMVLSYVLNLVEETWPWHDPHPSFYVLFKSMLERVDAAEDPHQVRSLLRVFELRLLFFLGIHPALDRCGNCGEKTTAAVSLDTRSMTVLCPSCALSVRKTGRNEKYDRVGRDGGNEILEMSKGLVRFYHDSLAQSGAVESVTLTKAVDDGSRNFFKSVFLNYLGKKLNVLEVRKELV